MKNYEEEIKKEIRGSIKPKQEMILHHSGIINDVILTIIKAYKKNKKIIWFGNGGSAADAQHLSCELVSKLCLERKPLPSIALTTNTSTLTAVSNDYDFEEVFTRQVEAFTERGDILVGITTSGRSINVIKALKKGKKLGATNVVFTGRNTKMLKDCADYIISVPSEKTRHIQEAHIMIGHIICYITEKELFGDKNKK